MDYSKMGDSELIRSYLSGNEAPLEALISKNQQRIFSYILVRIQDQDLANDIFQDTFVKVINTLKRGKYNEEGKFLQWTMRIAHNLIIDHYRREKRMPTMSPTDEFNIFDVLKDNSLNVESSLIKEQIEADLHKLIDQLPEDQKEVLKLRHFSGLSFKEISEQTGVSINTALGRMRYALINLRKLMEKNNVSLLMQ
ncbi:RNA polymerase sigma factor [Owenweeksia hongkongensis]|uniref:RNA polymerase sigma factor, sigma-70 family n=1 Tax=Owenweeksia hongkongensis (strain DSM 17368 / CIP 108786 / JCM 12287 / NRRL B-23963 / UST20020801) TaxID=926562 RepID=G8R229_OWEHD|nr:sigma-70 family RNA polymerase sigma factor [Owenweeksia hongkongensis]AEV31779.1 RNA polymerase sigma factor, sigma-70 family [Owenweeksia hongkongensis DSM 17368]